MLAALGAIAAGALTAAAPLGLQRLIDAMAEGGPRTQVLMLAAVYAGALGAARLAEQVQAYAFATGDQRLQQRLSAATFAHVLRLPMRFHLDQTAGGLMQTLSLGLQGARLILTHLAFSVLPLMVQLGVIGIVLVSGFDPALWLPVGLGVVFYGVVFWVGVDRLGAPTRAVSASQIEASGLFADGLANVEPLKALGAERATGASYQHILDEGERRWRNFHARRFENGVGVALVFAVTLGVVLMLGAAKLADGRMTLGAFVLLNTYLLQIIRPLEMAGFALRDLAQGAIYLEKWVRVMCEAPEAREAALQSTPVASAGPEICFEAVSFGYTPDRRVVRDVSFTIPSGGALAIVGESGAGKSSLVRLLLNYYSPVSGRILVDAAPLEAIGVDALRRKIALVSQDTVLLNTSLERNVLLARPDADPELVRRAIKLARLDELAQRLPAGLATLVGDRGLKLSGGEKQRVAIARAVLRDSPILVLDEATSALDSATEHAICADLIGARQGRTMLIVTHRLAVAAHADQILVMSQGRVIEHGAHAGLLRADGAYARLWRQQDAGVAA
jgi:ATP-binding cassette subfamily B protein